MQIQISNYDLRTKCGEGVDGVVWKAVKKDDGAVCAVKILRGSLKEILNGNGVPKEAEFMELLSTPGHPNIVKYFGWGQASNSEMTNEQNEKYFSETEGAFIVMEWIAGVNLESKVKDNYFGVKKRRHLCKQFLEAVHYIHSKSISHGSLYLNNLMVTKSPNSVAPRLVICDFSSAVHFSPDSSSKIESIVDKDRRQCGGIIFSLFSSTNLRADTKTFMQREAFDLARDLIDVRKPLALEEALCSPFLLQVGVEADKLGPYTAVLSEDIIDLVADCVIQTGEATDFLNASLVCKQFYTVFQQRFICANSKEQENKSKEFSFKFDYHSPPMPVMCPVEEWCYKLERVPYFHDWKVISETTDNDVEFELEWLQIYFESAEEHITKILQNLPTFTETIQPWQEILLHFHDMCGASACVGLESMRYIMEFARYRMRLSIGKLKPDYEDEKKLILRTLTLSMEVIRKFLQQILFYFQQHGRSMQHTDFFR